MTNRGYGIAAAILCAAGTLTAGALAYELRSPVVVPYSQSFKTASELIPTTPATSLTSMEAPFVVELPPILIVASPHVARATASLAPAAAAREITEMHCTDWKSLEQGPATGRVRLCQ